MDQLLFWDQIAHYFTWLVSGNGSDVIVRSNFTLFHMISVWKWIRCYCEIKLHTISHDQCLEMDQMLLWVQIAHYFTWLVSGNGSDVIVRSNFTLFHMISVWKWIKRYCEIKLHTISHDFPRFFDTARWVTIFVYLRTFMWMKEVWNFVIKIKCHGIIWLYFSLSLLCSAVHTSLCHQALCCHIGDKWGNL